MTPLLLLQAAAPAAEAVRSAADERFKLWGSYSFADPWFLLLVPLAWGGWSSLQGQPGSSQESGFGFGNYVAMVVSRLVGLMVMQRRDAD